MRRLTLTSETLSPLTPDEMTTVVGGSHACAVTDACTETVTHGPSIDATCPTPTLPLAICATGIVSQVTRDICA